MWALDGNNSLKRIARIGNRNTADLRVFSDSDYFLQPEFVDKFVVTEHQVSQGKEDELHGDTQLYQCTENWKAAAPDSQKHAWDMFDETGIFASACRHGFILWIADMIRSGEL